MALLAKQSVVLTGLETALTAAAGGGDTFVGGDHTMFYVVNGSGGDITVTFNDPNSTGPAGASAFNADVAVVVTAGERRMIGPFPHGRFRDPSDGLVHVTYSGVTSLTVAVVSI